jgi:hypothetical protein
MKSVIKDGPPSSKKRKSFPSRFVRTVSHFPQGSWLIFDEIGALGRAGPRGLGKEIEYKGRQVPAALVPAASGTDPPG